jgi:hypothetical protein
MIAAGGIVMILTPRVAMSSVADPPPAANSRRDERPLSLEAGVDASATFGTTCRRSGDLVGCSGGTMWAGFQASPQWQLLDVLSVGVRGALGWRPSTMGSSSGDGRESSFRQRLWRMSAEGRVHPWGTSASTDVWGAIEAGAVGATDTLEVFSGAAAGTTSVTQYAWLFGVGAGVDFDLDPVFAIGADLRLLTLGFGHEAVRLGADGDATAYRSQSGFSVGLHATVRPAL